MINMRDNTNRYFYLMALLMGSFVAVLALIALLFYILKLFAFTLFNIPGSAFIFHLFVTVAPYLILFAAYYLVHTQIVAAKSSVAASVARVILTGGSLVCVIGLTFTLLVFFKVKKDWANLYEDYAKYTFAAHLIIVLITAGVLATGDPKEKSWLERE